MDNYGEILNYQSDDGLTNIEVKVHDDTVWLIQQQMADLFQTSRTNVVEYIKHIYEEGELDEDSTCRKFRSLCTWMIMLNNWIWFYLQGIGNY